MADIDPKEAADGLRKSAWGDKGFPADPVTIARALGIRVVESQLPDDVSGALIKEKGKDATIIIHSTDSPSRKRFTIAHELGHFVSRSFSGDEEFECVDLRSGISSCGVDNEEIFANQFAANLLMPENEVKKGFSAYSSAVALAPKFGVSPDAMSVRLKNLKLT